MDPSLTYEGQWLSTAIKTKDRPTKCLLELYRGGRDGEGRHTVRTRVRYGDEGQRTGSGGSRCIDPSSSSNNVLGVQLETILGRVGVLLPYLIYNDFPFDIYGST